MADGRRAALKRNRSDLLIGSPPPSTAALRLRLTEYAPNLPRIRCEVNGQRVDLRDAAKLRNSEGDEWLVVDNPPLRQGNNAVLVVLEGAEAPDEWVLKMPGVNDGWPTLEQCELVVRSERK